ncbi:MAG: rhodanese-like domain-containing protein [Anaerolineae bacterium]|nr:rhodanese-like domain-containing protein [Anaerolineae bacterium]
MPQSKTTWIILALLLTALTLAACGGAQAPVSAAGVTAPAKLNLPVNVDAATVENVRNRADVVIIDVREDVEYAGGHIPGAVLIPLAQIPQRLAEIPQDKTVIAVCRSGNRSIQVTYFLQQQGFTNVHNMAGGMRAWSRAGYELEK